MGQYVTTSRPLTAARIRYVSGFLGSPGTVHDNVNVVSPLSDPKQTTFSWRSSPRLSNPDSIHPEDLSVTRNGFTTFDPSYDKGHDFWTESSAVDLACPMAYFTTRSPSNTSFYRGPVIPYLGVLSSYPTIKSWTSTSSEAMDYGSRAIKAVQPLRPNAAAGQFIGELFEGLPSMVGISLLKDRARILRSAGSEYLNVEFGWMPFISDIRKMVTALRRATLILSQLNRDSGRIVRRRFAFPSQVVSSTTNMASIHQSYVSYSGYLGSTLPTVRVSRTETDVWFSGAFSYAIPTDRKLLSRLEAFSTRANVLLGARIDPNVVWELAPWSWLIDWKLGIGNLISNASAYADDGLVIRYGYLMRHVRMTDQYQSAPCVTNTGYRIPEAFLTLRSERKERIRATPYGFGVSPSTFSDTQWTILGALGLSKGPRSLW